MIGQRFDHVAIRILPPAFATNPERLTRFEREARTLALRRAGHRTTVQLARYSGDRGEVKRLVRASYLATAVCAVGLLSSCARESTLSPSSVTSVCSADNITGDPNTSSPPRCVRFAGYDWIVKAATRTAPGPNRFSDSDENVRIDAGGLRLRLIRREGVWTSSEVMLARPLGYGRYEFVTTTRLDRLDLNVVFAFFTYNYPDPAFGHREIDIEFSPRLGGGAGARFTVQADTENGRDVRAPDTTLTTHVIDWGPGRVTFVSGAETWTYTGTAVPPPGGEHLRINLWLFGGAPPTNGAEAEVVVAGFRFTPS